MLFNGYDLGFKNGESATVSVGDWVKFGLLGLLNLVPIVGSLALLVIYIMLAANKDTAPSLRNACIAGFILAGVAIALAAVLFVVAFGVLGMSMPAGAEWDFSESAEF